MMRLKLKENEEIRTTIIRVVKKENQDKLRDYVYQHKHFENMLIILIRQNYDLFKEGKAKNDFAYLSVYQVMRAVIRGTVGGKDKEAVAYIKDTYKNHKVMQELIALGKQLKIHNLSMIIHRVKANFKGFFTKIKNGDTTARAPQPKKLSKTSHFSIPLDVNSWTFNKANSIGINLTNKMYYLPCNHKKIEKIIKNIDKIQAVTLHMTNRNIYFHIHYHYLLSSQNETKQTKEAGLDIGVNNLAGIFVADHETKSLIVSGKAYKHYNVKFNRFIGKLGSDISGLRNQIQQKSDEKTLAHLQKLQKFRSFIYEKRNRFFYDQFHKISKRILQYLHKNNVTDLYLSKNLAELKNNGQCCLSQTARQHFIQIPFIKLIQYIEYKASDYGIRTHNVDERYTSKSSCISSDIVLIQQKALEQNSLCLTNDFKGSRVKRGLFKDRSFSCVFNADINAAANIIKVGSHKSFSWLRDYLFKLCNPVKLSCDWELVCFLQPIPSSNK